MTMTLAIAGGVACGPLLGLDDLFERPALTNGPGDGGDGSASPGDGGADGESAECISNAQCSTNGSAALCVSSRCVAVDTTLCLPDVLPSNQVLASDDVALFAAFVPFQGGKPPLTQVSALAYGLAVDELSVGIPYDDNGTTRRRSVAIVLCASEPDVIESSVKHVTRDLRVPAMIAAFDNASFPPLVQNYAVPEGVFTLNPSTTTEALRYQKNPLVWNLLGVPEDVALAYRPLLEGVERHLRSDGGVLGASGEPLRVALLATNTSAEESIRDLLVRGRRDPLDGGIDRDKALSFNGMNVPDMPGDGGVKPNFRSITVNALENGEQPDYVGIKDALTGLDPHVVIALTRDELPRIVEDLESPDGGAGLRPIWLLGPRNAREVLPHLAAGGFADKQGRFLGVQYAGADDPTPKNDWLVRMGNKYPSVAQSDYSSAENFYDAVYWLAYGSAYPDGPLTGQAIGKGVRRLLAGTPIAPGSLNDVGLAFTTLGIAGTATFVGALGPPDINPELGTWNSVGGVYCFKSIGGVTIAPQYDVLRFNRGSGALDQRSQCFAGQFTTFGF